MKVLLYRVAGAVLALGMLLLAFVLASVFLAVFTVLALLAWLFLWWRTRHLRAELKARQGTVIEGEYRVEGNGNGERERIGRRPRDPGP